MSASVRVKLGLFQTLSQAGKVSSPWLSGPQSVLEWHPRFRGVRAAWETLGGLPAQQSQNCSFGIRTYREKKDYFSSNFFVPKYWARRLHFLADLDVSQLSVKTFRSTLKSLEAGACQSQTSCSHVEIFTKRFDFDEAHMLKF